MKKKQFILTFAVFLMMAVVLNGSLTAQTVSIIPNKDNTLYESATGALSNGVGAYLFAGRVASQNSGLLRRALLSFDIAGNVPAGATITSVALTLNMSKTISGNENTSLHRVLTDWGEGSSDASSNEGGGTTATTGDATWIHTFSATANWATAGGDFNPTASAIQSVGGNGSYTWGSTSQMVADVQDWLVNPSNNFGWILIGNESTTSTAKRFDSKDNSTEANRPVLLVEYSLETSVAENNKSVPSTFQLEQNYPNPFNPGTTIRYTLSQTSPVSLQIFDVKGQLVKTLVNEISSQGLHQVTWDGTANNGQAVAAGIYVYEISTGSLRESKKMLMLK